MNRDEKAVAIAEIATEIEESSAIFAVDYRGITVPDAAELRAKLREADATFKVVKNSLTERAADQVGAETLKEFLSGPTALTFVRGDVAVAAKAIADQGRATQLLPFKGGLMDGAPLDPDQIRSISRLPSRETLYGQLVGIVAAPVGGLVRSLNALVSGLAIALGQVQEKKVSGEIPAGEPPAGESPAPQAAPEAAEASNDAPAHEPEAPQVAEEPAAEVAEEPAPAAQEQATEAEAPVEEPPAAEAPEDEPAAEAPAQDEAPAEEPAGEEAAEPQDQAEPEQESPAQEDDNQADVSAEAGSDDAETSSTKED